MSLSHEIDKPPPYTKATESQKSSTSQSHDLASSLTQDPPSNISITSTARQTAPAERPQPTPGTSGHDNKIMLQPVQLSNDAIDPELQNAVSGDGDVSMTMTIDSEQLRTRRDPSSSIEDPDDRMAAEALYSLGKSDTSTSSTTATAPLPRSPSGYATPLKYYPTPHKGLPENDGSEPLLSLLTSSHPWLGGTLGGSISAYSSTKSYTPRFIQYGADIVENTVGTMGRRTGVEEGLRRYLGSRQPSSSLEHNLTQNKIKLHNDAMDVESGPAPSSQNHPRTPPQRKSSQADSVDTLPAYDNNRSPPYQESSAAHQMSSSNTTSTAATSTRRPQIPRSWSTQLMISTSGLGAALNETSLKSLKFCLTILSNANRHVRNLSEALKQLLQAFDTHAKKSRGSRSPEKLEEGNAADTSSDVDMADATTTEHSQREAEDHEEAKRIAEKIKQLNAEIWSTLKNVVNSVSRYTGGALPENASVVVRWQLMSVPSRWHKAVTKAEKDNSNEAAPSNAERSNGNSKEVNDTVGAANRMLNFAIEGLDMMEQVGGVVDSTITSAERWLERMGKGKGKEREGAVETPSTATEGADTSSDATVGPTKSPQAAETVQVQGEDEKMAEGP